MARRLLINLRLRYVLAMQQLRNSADELKTMGRQKRLGAEVKIRKTEYLIAIAIITSAAVLQIREHMQPHDRPSADVQAMSPCGITHNGLAPAACEPTRDKRQVDRAPEPHHSAPQMWV